MNKRIKELADKVGRIRDLYNIGPVHRDAVEQFAELIVRECAEVALWEQGKGYDVGETIKQHFGVE